MRSVRAFLVLGLLRLHLAVDAAPAPVSQDRLALRPHLPALVSSPGLPDRRHPPQCRGRGRARAGRAAHLEPRLVARHHRALGGGAGVVRGQAGGGVVAVRELARQAAALGVRRSQPAKRGGRQGERDPRPARGRRSCRAVRRRHLERRQQRGAVQDRVVRRGQAGRRTRHGRPRCRRRPWR